MSVNTIAIDKIVDPGVKKHFIDNYNQLKPQIDKIFKTGDQTSETDEFKNYTGLGQVAEVTQGGTYNEDAPIQAYGLSLTPSKFGKLIQITYETTKWAKNNDIFDAAGMLGKAMARHIEKNAASVIVNGFNTAYTSMTDAKPLFSVSHPRADGGTAQSNASSTGIALTDDNLEVALLAMEFQKDDRGELISVMANRLIIPPALRKKALVILKSDKVSNSADNDKNVYTMQEFYGAMDILVWDYLASAAGGSDTAWMLEDKSNSALMWQWAQQPKVERDNSIGFKQDTIYYKGKYYASKGWRDWRGTWASKGDGQAYAS